MFELSHQAAKLVNFNPRRELHGEEPKPAGDISFAANLASSELAKFDADLRGLLYCKRDAANDHIADAQHEAPNLRFPKLGPLKWGAELVGATVTLHFGVTEMKLPLCVINEFRFEPQEGGTCIIKWRVQCHPDESQAGKLSFLIGNDVEVSVAPPGDDDPAPLIAGEGQPLGGES